MLIDVWFLDMVLDVGWDGMVVSTGWFSWLVMLASSMLLGYAVSLVLALGKRPGSTVGHYQCVECCNMLNVNETVIMDGWPYCLTCFSTNL